MLMVQSPAITCPVRLAVKAAVTCAVRALSVKAAISVRRQVIRPGKKWRSFAKSVTRVGSLRWKLSKSRSGKNAWWRPLTSRLRGSTDLERELDRLIAARGASTESSGAAAVADWDVRRSTATTSSADASVPSLSSIGDASILSIDARRAAAAAAAAADVAVTTSTLVRGSRESSRFHAWCKPLRHRRTFSTLAGCVDRVAIEDLLLKAAMNTCRENFESSIRRMESGDLDDFTIFEATTKLAGFLKNTSKRRIYPFKSWHRSLVNTIGKKRIEFLIGAGNKNIDLNIPKSAIEAVAYIIDAKDRGQLLIGLIVDDATTAAEVIAFLGDEIAKSGSKVVMFCGVSRSDEKQIRNALSVDDAYRHRDCHRTDWENPQVRIHGEKCAMCKKRCSKPQSDHIVAIADGGSHKNSNCQPICGICHKNKTKEENRIRSEEMSEISDRGKKVLEFGFWRT